MTLDPLARAIEARTFDKTKVAASALVAKGVADSVRVEIVADELANMLVANLTAWVLSEPAGPTVSTSHTVTVPAFPKWLPRRLQRRWSKTRTLELTVEPKWAYPHADVPTFGDPKRIYYIDRGLG